MLSHECNSTRLCIYLIILQGPVVRKVDEVIHRDSNFFKCPKIVDLLEWSNPVFSILKLDGGTYKGLVIKHREVGGGGLWKLRGGS